MLQHTVHFMKYYPCDLILVALLLNNAMVNQNVTVLTWKYRHLASCQNFQEETTCNVKHKAGFDRITVHTGLEHISCVPFSLMANSMFGTVCVW
jgi:hypothetical protein